MTGERIEKIEDRGREETPAEILWGKCLAQLEWRESINQEDTEVDGTGPISLIATALAEARQEGIDELLDAAEQVVTRFRVEGHGDLRSVIACIRGEAEQLRKKA